MEITLLIAILVVCVLILFITFSSKNKNHHDTLKLSFDGLEKSIERVERLYQSEMSLNRAESAQSSKHIREEVATAVKSLSDSMDKRLGDMFETNGQRMERMRGTIEERMELLQKDNGTKLEAMRATVDEKLHATLEKRLGESFKHVSERLELVHKGLGEMQVLATGVGDLKKVLTNVKTRGTWGEVQLGSILDQILSSGQYAKNVAVHKGSSERVEFAIKLPTKLDDSSTVWLPIDCKFPVEDYQRLLAVREAADTDAMESASRAFENAIKLQARTIQSKYIVPPETTDYALLYLPTEGLFAEVTQRPGLMEEIQSKYRVTVAGPSTITALLSNLQMIFQTLAIGKRSSEVWSLLGAIKGDFGKFSDLLDKTQKKLHEASTTIEDAATKSRGIERRLDKVADLPENTTLGLDPAQVLAPVIEE